MKFYVGVDGGGTKTAISVAAADSSVLLSEVTSSASWREYGIAHVVETIRSVISGFPLGADGSVAGIAIGLPYYGESAAGEQDLESALGEAFAGTELYLTNDVEVGWAGSLSLMPGVNVVAGTGSIAFGKNEFGETARCGGWSEFFSDEGSCYWAGRKVLQIFSQQADGRMQKDALYDIVRRELGVKNDYEMIDIVHNQYVTNRTKLAALQILAKEAAEMGSQSAKELYKEAADELCRLAVAIRDRLHFKEQPFTVSYSGGLFKTGQLILPHFFSGIEAAGGKPVTPKFEPMYGALLLAFEKNFPEGLPQLKERLEKSKNIN